MTAPCIRVAKALSALTLAYLMYTMVLCPCEPELYKCHLTQIYGAIAVLVAIIVYFNGCRMRSYM